jgi:hypothetical protein
MRRTSRGAAPEASALWSRPQEVGYTLGERITGEASRTCILLFICWGAEDGGAGAAIASVIGAITGSSAPSDPLVRAAAAGAVLGSAQETDGIWVLNHETDSFDIFIFTRKSARVIGKAVALEVILTGDPLSSQRAYELGMVNKVVPEAQVMDEALKLAARITANAPLAVAASRAVAIEATTKTDDELWKASGTAFAGIVGTEDFREGPKAFIEKRAPVWKGK